MHFVNYLYDNYLCLLIRNLYSTDNITSLFLIIFELISFTLNQQNVKSSLYSVLYFFIQCIYRMGGSKDSFLISPYISSPLFSTTFRDLQSNMCSVFNQQMVYTFFQPV